MTRLVERLQQHRREEPEAVLAIAGDRAWTRAEVDDMSTQVGGRLLEAGLAPGDRVAIHLTNSIDIVLAYFACFKAGLIAVPINTRGKAPEVDYVIQHSEARAYIGQASLFAEAAAATASVPHRYLTGDDTQGLPSFTALSEPGAIAPMRALPPLDAPAMVLYTSGTTARPKGVTHTGRSLAAMAVCVSGTLYEPGDRPAAMLPLVHMAAISGLCACVWVGAPIVIVPFDPPAVLDAIERHKVTTLLGMPVLYRLLVEAQEAQPRNLSSLRACFVGGDSAPEALHQLCRRVFGVPLHEVYGLTEALLIAFNGSGRFRPGSLGRPTEHAEWRLVDGDGRDVGPGEVGQVVVRAPLMCAGYWNDPAATANAIKDGWLHTGDLARQDAEGYYWFAGRSKEIIVRGGSNVSPQEVEAVIYQHPAVRETAVVGKPDDRWGEIVAAFVVLKDGAQATADDLVAFAGDRLARYKAPELIVFETALPKGPTGKILRRPLRERLISTH